MKIGLNGQGITNRLERCTFNEYFEIYDAKAMFNNDSFDIGICTDDIFNKAQKMYIS